MKKHIISAVLAMACSIIAAAVALAQNADDGEAAASGPQPKMFIETHFFDIGDISPDTVVQHEFTIENQGAADLELKEVRPSCGCTVASFDKIIARGGTGRVLVKIRVYREWAGQDISKSVWLISNDPDSPQTSLTLSGRVLALGTDGNKPPLSSITN